MDRFDNELFCFKQYMNKFAKYIDFKMDNPYAENHPDFELHETPVTILDTDELKMDSYMHSQDSRSRIIRSKYLKKKKNQTLLEKWQTKNKKMKLAKTQLASKRGNKTSLGGD